MEQDFSASRSADKAWTTRLVLVFALLQMAVPLVGFCTDPQPTKRIYFLLYSGGILICLLSLAGTFHRRFWAVKSFCCVLSIAAIIGLQLANLILLLKDLSVDVEGSILMRKEIIQAIITFHLHFCLLFICPQLFGLNWLTMSSVVLCLLLVLICMWSTLGAATIFFPVLWVCTLLLLVIIISYWVELQERESFKASRLLLGKHEMLAQYESFWRSADAVRHESDLASAKARTALKCRNELTAFIFHEIRNPLNAMCGAVEMMMKGGFLTKDGHRWASVAQRSTLAMESVLNDVLLLSKLEEGKVVMTKEGFLVEQLVDEVVFMFSGQAKAAGVELVATVSDDVRAAGAVIGSKHRLAEVLSNFLSNSLKAVASPVMPGCATTATKRIKVRVRRLNGVDSATTATTTGSSCDSDDTADLEFMVVDSGRGLSAKQLHMAASPVPYATLADSSQSKGTGLGLVISKQLIEAHGGELIVRSAGLGRGSEFGFRAKFQIDRNPDSAGPEDSGNTPAIVPQGGMHHHERPCESIVGIPGAARVRVLVVDDDELNVSIVADMLRSEGMLCDTAANGAEALSMINAQGSCYDVVVTDLIMPVMNGRELSRRLRKQQQQLQQDQGVPTLPVIGLSGCCTPADKAQSLEAGMAAVLSKPANLRTLVKAVHLAIEEANVASNASDDLNDYI